MWIFAWCWGRRGLVWFCHKSWTFFSSKYYSLSRRKWKSRQQKNTVFESALDHGDMFNEFGDFLVEDLDNCYPMLSELRDDIHHINIPRKKYTSKNFFSDKLITFIYSTLIKFCKTEKIKGISLSTTFIENVKTIMDSSTHIHHSHITG